MKNLHIAYLVIKTVLVARIRNGRWSKSMNYWILSKTVLKLVVNPYYKPSKEAA